MIFLINRVHGGQLCHKSMLVLLAKPFITMLHKIVAVCDLVLAVILRMIMQHFCYSGSCVDYSSVIDAERLWRCVITFSGFDSPDSLYEFLLCQNLCNCGKLVLLSQLPPPARNNNRSFQNLKDHKVIVIFSRVFFVFFLGVRELSLRRRCAVLFCQESLPLSLDPQALQQLSDLLSLITDSD